MFTPPQVSNGLNLQQNKGMTACLLVMSCQGMFSPLLAFEVSDALAQPD